MGPIVYLLHSEKTDARTYVGSTTRGTHVRLREHNGELAGGARQTRSGRPWCLACTVEGFETRQQALQFEFAWRRVHRTEVRHGRVRGYGVAARRASLDVLMARERWSSRAPLASTVPLRVALPSAEASDEVPADASPSSV